MIALVPARSGPMGVPHRNCVRLDLTVYTGKSRRWPVFSGVKIRNEIVNSSISTKSCAACGSIRIGSTPYLTTEYKSMSMFENLEIYFCFDCGFGWSWPECDAAELDEFYFRHYRATTNATVDYQRLREPVVASRRAVAQLLLAVQHTDFRPGEMLVDFGPGGGASFSAACQVLDHPEFGAVELNSEAAEAYWRLYGAETHRDLESLVISGARPKIILASHSLEHIRLSDLSDFFSRVSSLMADGGVFVAEVPNVDMRLHCDKRYHDDPHLLFFSQESLGNIFMNFGLNTVFLNTCSALWGTCSTTESENNEQKDLGVMRSTFSRFPVEIQSSILRKYHAIRRDNFNFDSDDFRYGGDRICLRVVATKPRNLST